MGKVRGSRGPTVAAGAAMTLIGAYATATVGTSDAASPELLGLMPGLPVEHTRALPKLNVEGGAAGVGALLAGLSERTAVSRDPAPALVASPLAAPQVRNPERSRAVPERCRPASGLLRNDPVREFGLPGGASVSIWDTGSRANPMDEARLVAVRIPKGTLTPGVLTPSAALGSLATPAKMAAGHGKAVVVINGGVYDTDTKIPTGAVQVGERPRKADSLGSRAIAIYDGLKSAVVTRTGLTGLVSSDRGDVPVAAINWEELSKEGITAYTHSWNAARHPAGPRTVVVRSGRVREVLAKAAGMRRPAAGETFLTVRNGSKYLGALKAMRIGDRVDVETAVSSVREDHSDRPALDKPSAVIGVSAALVRYGHVTAPCSARDNQLRPRSALAWTADGDMLVVTVAGRALAGGLRMGGASAYGWGQYLQRLGAVSAVNLDGGGSTALLVRREVGGPLTRLDRGDRDAQRAVANALAFTTD